MKELWMMVAAGMGIALLTNCSLVEQSLYGGNGQAVTAPGTPAYHGRNFRDAALMAQAPGKKMQLHVSLDQQKGTLLVDGRRALEFPVSTGIPGHSTPKGNFSVLGKERVHHSSLYGSIYNAEGEKVVRYADRRRDGIPSGDTFAGAPMPYTMWFSGSCAFHEGEVPDPPMLSSHGCIHLPNEIAKELYALCPEGTPVKVES